MPALRWAFVLIVGVFVLGIGALAAPRQLTTNPVAANPPGNNGTIKVDGIPFDDQPNNEPHPGCVFQIDFYGFDEGDLTADVLFEAIPPTGTGQALLADAVFIGEDDNSGGGSEAGLDASQTYDLSTALQSFTPQPQQGYHVKLTIHADGSIGADTKFKVFWVGPCGPPGPPPVIPESPFPILLPLSAAGLATVALVLLRRRERRARAPTAEGRADY